jgi:hypothetical protein
MRMTSYSSFTTDFTTVYSYFTTDFTTAYSYFTTAYPHTGGHCLSGGE